MISSQKHITVYEHDKIHIDRGNCRINPAQLNALQQFYGENGVPYFELIHNGIKFNEYVGVLMVGKTMIEILPKANKDLKSKDWRKVLIGMLHAVGLFNIHAPSSTTLDLRANSILELYFELFVSEVEYLLHRGLIKKYRKTSGNINSLKGSIHFPKHINSNLIHKERFFVNYTTYDKEHIFHQILHKALKLLQRINGNIKLQSRISSLMLDFPEMPEIKISENTFNRIIFDRKSSLYKNSIEIARLLLLNYHPDIKIGANDVLALMFDMNHLWERFVYVSLQKHKKVDSTITAQNTKDFWRPSNGYKSKIKPDIIINKDKGDCIVLDTKWKNIKQSNPSPNDLRQMYVYMKFYNANRVALVYPNSEFNIQSGLFYKESNSELSNNQCSLISIGIIEDIKQWQVKISEHIHNWK